MARINIEDSIWKDERFQDLMIKVGNRHQAKGMMIEFWALAQEYWFPKKQSIPFDRIEKAGLGQVVQCGLGETFDDGVRALGCEKAFEWLFKKQAAGKASAESRKVKPKRGKKGKFEPSTDERLSTDVNVSQPLSLTPTLFSSSDSSSNSDSSSKNKTKDFPSPPSLESLVWDKYSSCIQARWKATPVRNAVVNSQIKNLVKKLGADSVAVTEFYVMQHNDGWYLKNQHPIGALLQKAESIHIQWQRGAAVTSAQVKQFEQGSYYDDLRKIALKPEEEK